MNTKLWKVFGLLCLAWSLGLAWCSSAANAEKVRPASSKIVPPTAEWKAIVEANAPAQPTVVAQKRRLLVFSLFTGFNHLVIPHVDSVFQILGDKTQAFDVDITTDIEHLASDYLADYDVLVLNNNCSQGARRNLLLDELERNPQYANLTTDQREAKAQALEDSMEQFVAEGNGLVVVHGAPTLLNNSEEFTKMVGAAFDYHPPSQTVTVRVVDAAHPLVKAFRGQGPLIHLDEPYCFNGAYTEFNFRPLLSMDVEGLKDPAGRVSDIPRYVAWIKPYGKGRVFYCSPSHYPASYESPTLLRFILDGTQYAAGDLKCDDSTPQQK